MFLWWLPLASLRLDISTHLLINNRCAHPGRTDAFRTRKDRTDMSGEQVGPPPVRHPRRSGEATRAAILRILRDMQGTPHPPPTLKDPAERPGLACSRARGRSG